MNIPLSTYRVQLHKDFNFKDLSAIIEYLSLLGVNAIYASPIFMATPGSTHGYDVTDPHVINPELGSIEELKALSLKLKENGMLWIQDIVPNHMAFNPHNKILMDVLERGPISEYYNYFDINWSDAKCPEKVMVPFLGSDLKSCLDKAEVKLELDQTGFYITYYDSRYPLSLPAYDYLLHVFRGNGHTEIAEALAKFIAQANVHCSYDAWNTYKKLWLTQVSVVEMTPLIEQVNEDKSLLNALLATQYYKLTYWKDTEQQINYRRFFTINDLICLSMEKEEVFDNYHSLVYKLYAENIIQGVRIDHIDGLRSPVEYLKRLRSLLGEDAYIVVEKILESDEMISPNWPIQGETGYQFLTKVNQLTANQQGVEALKTFYHSLPTAFSNYSQLVNDNKWTMLKKYMGGEWDNLTDYFFDLQIDHNYDKAKIKEALGALMVAFEVYRIYPEEFPLEGANYTYLKEALNEARHKHNALIPELDFLEALFLKAELSEAHYNRVRLFVNRLSQFTGPLMAKGVEDTTFYNYHPLLSLSEVGGDPQVSAISVDMMHEFVSARKQDFPYAMNATSTHDTKRGEDARMRLNSLSGEVSEWTAVVDKLFEYYEPEKGEFPQLNDQYFIYQSIIGAIPEGLIVNDVWVNRLSDYVVKALREGKRKSNWEEPDSAYEACCKSFIEQLLKQQSYFMQLIRPLMKSVLPGAHYKSQVQVLLKLTLPGVPDVYQGCEVMNLSFVDPDNRRSVDYLCLKKMLSELMEKEKLGVNALFDFWNNNEDLAVRKLYLTYKLLHLRQQNPELFLEGKYLPLLIGEGVFSFIRKYKNEWLVVVTCLDASFELPENLDLKLPEKSPYQWKNILTNEFLYADKPLELRAVCGEIKMAVLVGANAVAN